MMVGMTSASPSDHAPRRAAFRRLHESGCFLLPNPWDAGTARYLRRLGFAALATTSSGFAFSRGLPDGEGAVPVEAVLGHVAEIVAAPGRHSREDIAAIVAALAPRPVNVLMGASTGLRLADLAALGVRRVSVGSGLARAAWTAFIAAARAMAREGSFAGLAGAVDFAELNGFFREEWKRGTP